MTVRIACFGVSGHQIDGSIGGLERAALTAFGGISIDTFNAKREADPALFAETAHVERLDDLLARDDVDLVSLCSQNRAAQARHAVQALEAGKHVLAEKPMATTLEDLAALRSTAAGSDRRLWTMTSMVYDAPVKALKAIVDSGQLGTLVQVHAQKSYPYHDRRPQDRSVDGGIMQVGIHGISLIGHLTGLAFEEVVALDTARGNPGKGELQMAATVACRMSDGCLASIVCNYCNPPGIGYWGNDQIRVHGTQGMAEMVDGFTRRTLVLGDAGPRPFDGDDAGPRYPQDMIDAILDGSPTLLSEEDGLRYTEAAIRAQMSMSGGSSA